LKEAKKFEGKNVGTWEERGNSTYQSRHFLRGPSRAGALPLLISDAAAQHMAFRTLSTKFAETERDAPAIV
jgi:hypothetical protein